MGSSLKPPIRIGNVSGATGDHPHAMRRMLHPSNAIDVITGDWLSEMNIAWNQIAMKEQGPHVGFENGFYVQLEECIDDIVSRGVKVVTNAGALNPLALVDKIKKLLGSRGYDEGIVAVVLGDNVLDQVQSLGGAEFPHLDHPEQTLQNWQDGEGKFVPSSANAYIGCWGIVEALNAGAQIVICGRCTDASPVMGAAAWYHGWQQNAYEELAGALVAAHLIECGPYVVGANFSGFKDFLDELVDLAFPVAEIDEMGGCVITRTKEGGGRVTVETVKAQLLYELQGHLYLNPDVVANLAEIRVENDIDTQLCHQSTTAKENRVRVLGVKGLPPPPTTKVMVAAEGGYQAEATFFINGLDIAEKAVMMRQQLAYLFKDNKFSKFSIEQYGSTISNPSSQQQGTVSLRVFAQARRKEDIDPVKFKIPIYAVRMQSYPGYHMSLDFRTMEPKAFMEIFPTVIALDKIDHRVMMHDGRVIRVQPPKETRVYLVQRPSVDVTQDPVDLVSFGPTEFVPLGSIVHARSGDKANNSNVGFFVRNEDEYAWLRTVLTVDCVKQLFGEDWYTAGDPGRRVERVEFPGIWAVHFRILDNLNGGIASSDRIDGLGKGVGEYLRSRYVHAPRRFLERGRI